MIEPGVTKRVVTAPSAGRRPMPGPAAEQRSFRPDVQGLRAIAVSLVVVYHLYPGAVPGGFVGVDVFFVISGYLITSHLARTTRQRGRVGVLDFYGRRARRLMPAAVLVLTVTWIVSSQVLPATQLPDTANQIRASALYFQNWVLARDAVSYLRSDAAATPVQHFWSLSVEEQFYLLWPLLFLLAAVIGHQIWRRQATSGTHSASRSRVASGPDAATKDAQAGGHTAVQVMFVLALAVIGASLWFSAHETAVDPAAAYFVTPTRMWELGVGGALALAPASWRGWLERLGPLSWAGLALVIASAFLITGSSAFPGLVALAPVGGAALLIACGGTSARRGSAPLLSLAPMVFLGDISYSLYLWHWPLIVWWKTYYTGSISAPAGLGIAAVSVVLAWLTKVFVEDTVRRNRFVVRSPSRSLATLVVIAVPVTLVSVWHFDTGASAHKLAPLGLPVASSTNSPTGSSTAGPQPLSPSSFTINPDYPGAAALTSAVHHVPDVPARPSLAQAGNDYGAYGSGPGGCQSAESSSTETVCHWGDTTGYTKTIAVVGDSVAAEFFDDLNALAKREHWLLITDLHSLCPWSATMTSTPTVGGNYTACHTWGERALRTMLALKPTMVYTSARPTLGIPSHTHPDPVSYAAIGAGMADYWRQLIAHGIAVTAIRETPEMNTDIPDCLSRPGNTPADCATPAKQAIRTHTPLEKAKSLVPQAALIDLTRYFCTETCEPIVGNIVVYIDSHHVTTTYASTVAPYLYAALLKLPALR